MRTQYLVELNTRPSRLSDYVQEMMFVPVSGPDVETAVGFDWVLGGLHPRRLFAVIAAEVHALFRVLDL